MKDTHLFIHIMTFIQDKIYSMNRYYVYILSSDTGTLYIGVTNDIERRVFEHKNGFVDGFTKKYHVHRLVYYEYTEDVYSAIMREKEIKKWLRKRKIKLIKSMNPKWEDLSSGWFGEDFYSGK